MLFQQCCSFSQKEQVKNAHKVLLVYVVILVYPGNLQEKSYFQLKLHKEAGECQSTFLKFHKKEFSRRIFDVTYRRLQRKMPKSDTRVSPTFFLGKGVTI